MGISQTPRAGGDSPDYRPVFNPLLLPPNQRKAFDKGKQEAQNSGTEQRRIEGITSFIKKFVDNNRTPLKGKTWETIFQETNNGVDLSSFEQTNISPDILNNILALINELSEKPELDRSIIPFPE